MIKGWRLNPWLVEQRERKERKRAERVRQLRWIEAQAKQWECEAHIRIADYLKSGAAPALN